MAGKQITSRGIAAIGIIATMLLLGGIWHFIVPHDFGFAEKTIVMQAGSRQMRVLICTFSRRVWLPENWTIRACALIPVDESGRPLPSASDVVFYAPFRNDTGDRLERNDWMRDMVVQLGCSIFSVSMDCLGLDVLDHRRYYVYPESGWASAVFAIHRRLVRRYRLAPRRLVAVGQSAGGSMIQQMAARHPDRLDAGAWCGGGHYAAWPAPNAMPLMSLSTAGCHGSFASDESVRQLREKGGAILRRITPPLNAGDHHSIGLEARQAVISFIGEMLRQRAANHGAMPPPRQCYDALQPQFWQRWEQLAPPAEPAANPRPDRTGDPGPGETRW